MLRRFACAAVILSAALAPSTVLAGTHVDFQPSNMEQLHAGEGYYELWALIDGTPISLGQFNADSDGTTINEPNGQDKNGFDTALNLDADATELWVTAEPEGSLEDGTPAHKLLAGNLSNSAATLVSSHPNGMGVSFATASGSYVLTTPSTASDNGDFMYGVWFMSSSLPRAATLVLPTLPTGLFGWQYQGWIADLSSADPIPFSTGEFSSAAGSDFDLGGPCAGPDVTPSFPGSDFVSTTCNGFPHQPVMNDGNWSIVFTVEPSPNTGPNPFGFKPLQIPFIPAGTGNNISKTLNNTSNTLPTASATLTPTAVEPTTWGDIKAQYR